DEPTKVRGRHTGIAAELIDLIRRGLDEQRCIAGARLAHGTLNNSRVRRAQGVHTGRLSPLVPRHDVEQRLHRCGDSSGSTASSSAAVRASAMPAILYGPSMAAASNSDNKAVSSGAPALISGETMIALPWRNANTNVRAPMAFNSWIAAASPGPSSE